MSKIKVHAGDIENIKWEYSSKQMFRHTSFFKAERYMFGKDKDIVRVEPMDEEKVKKLSGTAGWGIAGAALLGPLGAIGGMLIGGNKKQVVFAAYMKDGRKFMASTDNKTFTKIQACLF